MRSLELKIPPVVVLAIFAVAAIILAKLTPIARVDFAGRYLASFLIALLGVSVALAGVFEFRCAKTSVNPLKPNSASTVVSTGIFRYSRNPMYVGMALALLSIITLTGSIVALAMVPAFCVYMTNYQIKPEERMLQQTFGETYLKYMLSVRRWL
ncbi:isoprenylcysteine carboxylmethyltransferase family protein [Candidatus Chloroploca sp. Khr17]|uniref:methyltransferase family protein n=1 Tax=Candidatus Chloroploca sp. Khr17 TaxID=2496869 RepID=UPI00101B9420|nr:isoprenylcysteine carboxylmethyltransferase family protein [Candidatus Chloroploca sp. Khr17]